MFAIPGQDPVTLTPAAIARIRALMDGGEVKGLKIGVKKGGCAGMEYTMEHATEIGEHDAVIEQDGARVLIAGFVFNNPNVVDSCGCGESIKFAEAGEPR